MQNVRGGKMYIQDKVEEYKDQVFDLMNNGAHMYFCGLKGMMPGAHARRSVLGPAGTCWDWPGGRMLLLVHLFVECCSARLRLFRRDWPLLLPRGLRPRRGSMAACETPRAADAAADAAACRHPRDA